MDGRFMEHATIASVFLFGIGWCWLATVVQQYVHTIRPHTASVGDSLLRCTGLY